MTNIITSQIQSVKINIIADGKKFITSYGYVYCVLRHETKINSF